MTEINDRLVRTFLQLSIEELKERNFGATEQYLEVIEVLKADDLPVIRRVEQNDDGNYSVYFPVKDEAFYYTHYFSVGEKVELVGTGVTPASEVYLRVYSSTLTLEEMLAETTLSPSRTYRKGDFRGKGKDPLAIHNKSRFDFQLDTNNAGEVEVKLLNLLSTLEAHQAELERLTAAGCKMYISFYWESYTGNTMIGGFYFTREIIAKLHKLNLEVDFDLYTAGKPFN